MALRNCHLALAALLAMTGTGVFGAADSANVLEPVRAQLRVKNFSRAVELLTPIAEQGNAQAELLLANLYRQGFGIEPNQKQTQQWLTRAAEHGNADAMFQLAALLGEVDPPDHALIQQWLQRAAQAGHGLAIEALRNRTAPLQFQPAALTDTNARQEAFWLAATRNDIAQLSSFNDPTLINASDEFGRAALFYAARTGASSASEWLLKTGANPNQTDHFGVTPLMLAAGSGQLAIIHQLIKSGVPQNAQDKSGNNALMYAIARRQDDCVAALLPLADIRQRNAQGWSALDWAVNVGNATLATRLRDLGLSSTRKLAVVNNKPSIPLQRAGSNDLYNHWPDILVASTREGTELFDAIVQTNANALRGQETAALLLAVQSNNTALVDRLLSRGASIDSTASETSLSWAVRHGKPELAQKLLTGGMKPDAHGKNESAPLLDAVRASADTALTMMNMLLKSGANPDVRDRNGRTPLMISAPLPDSSLMSRLLQSGANTELVDNAGRTALMHVVLGGNTDALRQLLGNKAALDKRDRDDNNALMLAASAGNADAVAALIAAGASTQGNKEGVTALMLAAASGQEDIVKKLLSAGMKSDTQDRHGDTALIYAVRKGHVAAARTLVSAGADAGLRNNDRASARDVAERLAFKDLTALLVQR